MQVFIPPTWPLGHVGGRLLHCYYDMYRLQLQFHVPLMTGVTDTQKHVEHICSK